MLPGFLCHLILPESFPVQGGGGVTPSLTEEKVRLVFIHTSPEKLGTVLQKLVFCICLHHSALLIRVPWRAFLCRRKDKMNTESNLNFQTAGLGPTALKLWKEMITLRDENFVVVIFAMVPLSHSRVGRSKCICYALGCLSDNTGLFSCNQSTSMCCLPLSLPWKHSIW